MYKTILSISIFLFCWISIHTGVIISDGLHDTGKNADIGLVLGNRVQENGVLSPRLEARVKHALELYRNHHIKKIYVSGGYGKEGFFEGDKMAEFLVQNGVPTDDIFIDNAGTNTEKSVYNILHDPRIDSLPSSIMIISQYYHISRVKLLFYKTHYTGYITSSSPFYFEWRDIYALLREYLAFYKSIL